MCVKDLRGFLGLTGYYRKFINNYRLLNKPLTELLKKNAFRWSDMATKAFTDLKEAMCTAPVLSMPDFTQEFTLETDASDKGVRAILMQHKRSITYFSKALGVKSRGMSTYEKELIALLTAVQRWRHYLEGKPFVIKIDHISLKHLLEQHLTHIIQHKGLSKLMRLNYVIQYKKGVENKAADALSRIDHTAGVGEKLVVSEIIPTWLDELRSSYQDDTWATAVLQGAQEQGNLSLDITIHAGVIRKNGRVYVGSAQG
jgi:RNase H-like domain found in reverse transcriptase